MLLLDGAPTTAPAREALAVLLEQGPALGVFPVCLAETPQALPAGLGATAVVTGEVATQLTLDRPLGGGARELVRDLALDAVSRLGRAAGPGAGPAARALSRGLARGPLPERAARLDLLSQPRHEITVNAISWPPAGPDAARGPAPSHLALLGIQAQ
ncbi:hypothetical protein GCM10020229_76770 [Kitasatospora albolonga]|uniref:hypothetical protein n=1 Tax=Kitasatospora albolonga TaxID=68173 RepID=UPI0031E9C896